MGFFGSLKKAVSPSNILKTAGNIVKNPTKIGSYQPASMKKPVDKNAQVVNAAGVSPLTQGAKAAGFLKDFNPGLPPKPGLPPFLKGKRK